MKLEGGGGFSLRILSGENMYEFRKCEFHKRGWGEVYCRIMRGRAMREMEIYDILNTRMYI